MSVVRHRHRRPEPSPLVGFTLIELLVVISTVAVLAALLLPALAGAKANANSIKCRSNLRQMGLGLVIYVNDHDVYPMKRWVDTNLIGAGTVTVSVDEWAQWQEPEPQGIQKCPSRVRQTVRGSGMRLSWNPGSLSYGYNGEGYIANGKFPQARGLAGIPVDGGYRHVSESEVLMPSDMLALGDSLALLSKDRSAMPTDAVMESIGISRSEISGSIATGVVESVKRATARHRNRANIVFCDGHAEAKPLKRLFLDRNDASLRQWNRDHEPHRD
jgi:prepilin-type processing-associated H-X9-DG protein